MTEFEHWGTWWLPGEPEHSVPGIFRFSQEEGGQLQLFGDLHVPDPDGSAIEIWASHDHPVAPFIILGITKAGRVTLHRCLRTNHSIGTGGVFTTFEVREAFIGQHFSAPEEIRFRKVGIRFSRIEEWRVPSGIEQKLIAESGSPPREFHATYRFPASHEANLPAVRIRFNHRLKRAGHRFRVDWQENPFIEVEPHEPTSLLAYRDGLVYHLRNFISFGLTVPVYPTSMYGYADDALAGEAGDASKFVDIYYTEPQPRGSEAKIGPDTVLFTFEDVSENLPSYLERWFLSGEKYRPVHGLYFGTMYAPFIYGEPQFVALVQALEVYHRTSRGGTYLPKATFRKCYKRVKELLAEDAWLLEGEQLSPEERLGVSEICERLSHQNEYKLRRRLDELLDDVRGLVEPVIPEPEEFARKVTNTRNYYTHYSSGSMKGVFSYEELVPAVERLKFLLQLHLLRDLGLPDETMQAAAQRRARYILGQQVVQYS